MKKLSDFINGLKPTVLARLRKRSIYDGTRDKKSLLRQVKKLEEDFSSLGHIVFYTDFDYLKILAGDREKKIDNYWLRVEKDWLLFRNSQDQTVYKVKPQRDLVKKLINLYKGLRIDMTNPAFKDLPNDDILTLVREHGKKGKY